MHYSRIIFQSILIAVMTLSTYTTSIAQIIEAELKNAVKENQLNFPILTQKIYRERNYQSIWFNSINNQKIWNATDLIATASLHGLNQTDFHCTQLSAGNLNTILEHPSKDKYTPNLDILLTDAMLSFISNLHYGKANPQFPRSKIDNEKSTDLKIDSVFLLALNSPNFSEVIINVEPSFIGYKQLQQHLKLLVGQYVGDCYEISDETVKLIALNLERWRWINTVKQPYLHINIPAYTLSYVTQNNIEQFKVVVGKPLNPTPTLASEIHFFTTSPDWTVPQSIVKKELLPKAIKNPSYLDANNFRIYDKKGNTINGSLKNLQAIQLNPSNYIIKQSPGCDNSLGKIVFNFKNPYSVYVHDTPDRAIFNRSERALSHGCIRVQNPERLVQLLLEDDSATTIIPQVLSSMKEYKNARFNLKKPVPILISYLTCEIKDGMLLIYKDIYFKDKALMNILKFEK